jgi:hypothetical protein
MSTNLREWQDLATVLATGIVLPFQDASAVGAGERFYRAVTLP